MEINTRTIGKCKVLDCSGKLVLGPATEALRNAIREAVQDGTQKVVLNLDKVTLIDSCGIGELISGLVHLRSRGGNISLLNINKKIDRPIYMVKLQINFEIFDDEKSALSDC